MGFNPLKIGSYCNMFSNIIMTVTAEVSIPLKSGHIVIRGTWHTSHVIFRFNPLKIGSYCNHVES